MGFCLRFLMQHYKTLSTGIHPGQRPLYIRIPTCTCLVSPNHCHAALLITPRSWFEQQCQTTQLVPLHSQHRKDIILRTYNWRIYKNRWKVLNNILITTINNQQIYIKQLKSHTTQDNSYMFRFPSTIFRESKVQKRTSTNTNIRHIMHGCIYVYYICICI